MSAPALKKLSAVLPADHPFHPKNNKHQLITSDIDLFNVLYRQGNEYIDASIVRGFIQTQNIPMLLETVCWVLDLCQRFNQTTTSILTHRDPTLIGNRFALKGVIDTLAINLGHVETSSDYTIPLISLIFTYNPETINFIALLRSRKNWTSATFRQAFTNSLYHQYISCLKQELTYIPFSLLTRLKLAKSFELAFVKYINPAHTTPGDGENAKLSILPNVYAHMKDFNEYYLSNIDGIENYIPKTSILLYSSGIPSSPQSTMLYNDRLLELPIHVHSSVSEFSSYIVFSQLAGYGITMEEFLKQIPQAMLRYLAIACQSYNFEAFKFIMAIDMFMNGNGEAEGSESEPAGMDSYTQCVYNDCVEGCVLPETGPATDVLGNYTEPQKILNFKDHNIQKHVPQSAMIGNIITESVVTQILMKYTYYEKIQKISNKIAVLKTTSAIPAESEYIDEIFNDEELSIADKIKIYKQQISTYYNLVQLCVRFHEGIFSLYRYDFSTPSQLVTMYIAAFCYNDTFIMKRLEALYGLTMANLFDYDNTTHIENIANIAKTPTDNQFIGTTNRYYFDGKALSLAYRRAITDTKFKQSSKTLMYDLFYNFTQYQLPKCIEYYLITVKKKQKIFELTLPINPLCIALGLYDVDMSFIQWLIDNGSPFIPHSKFGDQFNILTAILSVGRDQFESKTLTILNFIKDHCKNNTKETLIVTIDEFFAHLARETRMPLSVNNDHLFPQNGDNSTQNQSIIVKSLWPRQQGLKRNVLQWFFENCLDRAAWAKSVLGSPDVVLKAMTNLIQISEPTPITGVPVRSSVHTRFEQDLMTIIQFFLSSNNIQAVMRHPSFPPVVSSILRYRCVNILEYFLQNGYVVDRQVLYLFSLQQNTFTDYNDWNVYIPQYRELVNSSWKGARPPEALLLACKEKNDNNANTNQSWTGKDAKLIPLLCKPQKKGVLVEEKVEELEQVEKMEETVLDDDGNEVNTTVIDVSSKTDPAPLNPILKTSKEGKKFIEVEIPYTEITMLDVITDRIGHDKDQKDNIPISDDVLTVIEPMLKYKCTDYDNLPPRRPAQCPKFGNLQRFDLASKQGLSQYIASSFLIDYKTEDVLGKVGIPKLSFDVLESICAEDIDQYYETASDRAGIEKILGLLSIKELGKCNHTVLNYLYYTYYLNYISGAILAHQQSSFLRILFLLITYCPETEYALYMLATPIDGVGFLGSCNNWLLYKIIHESFPTARVPLSLSGKMYHMSSAPQRPTSSMSMHLSSALIMEEVLRYAIHSFNQYTIASRTELEPIPKAPQPKKAAGKKGGKTESEEPPPQPSQEFSYQLEYHSLDTHYPNSIELQSYKLAKDGKNPKNTLVASTTSPIYQLELAINGLYTPAPTGYVNQRYFDMLSIDQQFQSLELVVKPSKASPNTIINGIYVSHIAQRALIALACEMLFQYKLDAGVSKDVAKHRDIRESTKVDTNRDEFITSNCLFRRIFTYTRFIPQQWMFFFCHLIPTGDPYVYLDIIELAAFFTQMGRDGIFNQDIMFIAQPIQYHVFPASHTYKTAIKNALSLLYEFNYEYALNRVQDNVKIMNGEDPKADQKINKNSPTPSAITVTPTPALSPYNMANYYTMYYNTLSDPVYRFDLIPQKNNAINPYIFVDLAGSLLIDDFGLPGQDDNEEAGDIRYCTELPETAEFVDLSQLWIKMCEARRASIFGAIEAPEWNTIPLYMLTRDSNVLLSKKHQQESLFTSQGPSSAPQGDDDALMQLSNHGMAQMDLTSSTVDQTVSTKGSSAIMTIGAVAGALAAVAAGAMYYFSNMSRSHPNDDLGAETDANTEPKQRRKGKKRP